MKNPANRTISRVLLRLDRRFVGVFTKLGGVDFNQHRPQNIMPIPSPDHTEDWKADYKTMQEQMIYGESPSYENWVKEIQEFLERRKSLDWRMRTEFPLPKS